MVIGNALIDNLYIGSKFDYENSTFENAENWLFVHACKTYHKKVLGYPKNLPKSHPYYLKYIKDNHIYVNLIDVNDYSFFDDELMHFIIDSCLKALLDNKKVYIHCDEGLSRSPMIGMLVLKALGYFRDKNFDDSFKIFGQLVPYVNPKGGIYFYCKLNWDNY